MNSRHYPLSVFLGGCCYGILSTFVKLAYTAGFTVQQVTISQYLFGFILIWCFYLLTAKHALNIKQISKLLLTGTPFGLTGIFYYQSLQTLNASLAIIFLFQFVWIGSVFDYLFNKHLPSLQKILSIIILLLGSMFAANISSPQNISMAGSIWGLLAAFSYTIFSFLSSSIKKNAPPLLKSALIATGGLITISIIYPPTIVIDSTLLLQIAPYGFLLGFFGVALPPFLFSIGMPHVGIGFGSLLTASELPIAIIMSMSVLGETVYLSQIWGIVLILLAIILYNLKFNKLLSFFLHTKSQ
ncbi:EamA family transporter [Pectinatus brassicae]|uniref:Drug/metabolite transporter (DMT)-like permease n=1 Tax=Pectinatus brassicae TaxID=862415 RepID=A0A840UPV9_9FIRM|nr:DMT family transporter [Pectinatus brassicae]MBB5336232.1 drug/metabolite transporter (DMT)-like permease [Pectinatus brassicae]